MRHEIGVLFLVCLTSLISGGADDDAIRCIILLAMVVNL